MPYRTLLALELGLIDPTSTHLARIAVGLDIVPVVLRQAIKDEMHRTGSALADQDEHADAPCCESKPCDPKEWLNAVPSLSSISDPDERALRVSPIHFAAAVRRARRQRGISRRRLGHACGLSRHEVAEIEARRHWPTGALLDQLSVGLGGDLTMPLLEEEHLAEFGGANNRLYVNELPPKLQAGWLRWLRS